MRVTDAQVAALRAFLLQEPDVAVHLAAGLGETGMPGYLHLAEAALSVAGQRFSPQFTRADLVRYVALVCSVWRPYWPPSDPWRQARSDPAE